jgi:hypothetical protein
MHTRCLHDTVGGKMREGVTGTVCVARQLGSSIDGTLDRFTILTQKE